MDELFSKKLADATTVKVWSDVALAISSRINVMGSLDKSSRKHKVQMTWNFSATSHGKGPVDRVRATVKRGRSKDSHKTEYQQPF